MHNSVSIDGRLDFAVDMGLHYGVLQGISFQAHLAGSGTILTAPMEAPDDAPEDVVPPPPNGEEPGSILAVADARGRVRRWTALSNAGLWKRFIALVCEQTPGEYLEHLAQRGVEWIEAGQTKVDLPLALEALGSRYGVETVLLDSGGTLNAAMIRAGLVDELSLLLHPSVVGSGTPLVVADLENDDPSVTAFRLLSSEKLDADILWLRYEVGP
jgi:2,5-diamino-6-(ribosylamino)-4(3H)-pyrimidinone 5'-phosphate reductase